MKSIKDIIIRPIFTEKTERLQQEQNIYTFQVGLQATKPEIKKAVEELFGVKVEWVRTLIMRGKPVSRRFGRRAGRKSKWKKAYVKVAEGQTIDFAGM